jgi:hypothetical protein
MTLRSKNKTNKMRGWKLGNRVMERSYGRKTTGLQDFNTTLDQVVSGEMRFHLELDLFGLFSCNNVKVL